MSGVFRSLCALLGRIALSSIFVESGLSQIADWTGSVQKIAAKGIPGAPFCLFLAIGAQLLGSVLLITGYRSRLGAWMLIFFLAPTTFFFHAFWDMSGAEQRIQLFECLKNISIAGGLLMLVACGPGPLGVGPDR